MTALDLNRRLAPLLGWTNIIELGGALLGTPPAGQPQCRNQAEVPNWAGDWRDCGPLLGKFKMEVNLTETAAYAKCKPVFGFGCFQMLGKREHLRDHATVDDALRAVIVGAAIAKLEASQ